MNTRLIILFGSQVSGKNNVKSDIDVAVLADRPISLAEKASISDQVAKKMNVSSDLIDLVDLSVASPLLQYSVAQNSKIIFGNEDDFLRFKVLAWKKYLDTAKFRSKRKDALRSQLLQH